MRRLDEPELLDDHDAPPADVERSLRDLRRFNRYAGGARVYRKMVSELKPSTVIDLGAGTADLVDSLRLPFSVAVDWNIRHLLYERDRSPSRRVVADARRLPFRDGAADAVTSSHFFHHFTPEENAAILRESLRVARTGVAMTDTSRHVLPLLFTLALRWLHLVGRITRYDAPASIRRGYTTAEVRLIVEKIGARRAAVRKYVPYRWALFLWK